MNRNSMNNDLVELACWAMPVVLALLPKCRACRWITAAGTLVVFIWSYIILRSEVDYPPVVIVISVILWFVAAWRHWRPTLPLECAPAKEEG